MTTSEWIAIISVITIVFGWFFNSELNRRNEIAKKRLEFRLDTLIEILDSFSDVRRCIKANKFDDISEANLYRALGRYFFFFSKEKEIKFWEIIAKKAMKNQSIDSELIQLMDIVSKKIREELKFK